MPMIKIGASAGLTFRYDGGMIISIGRRRCARSNAACTSTAALSMSRSLLNSRDMLVLPREFTELMSLIPSMVENSFSRGSATAEAMVSGEAPGKLALTEMTGVLKLGRAATGILV